MIPKITHKNQIDEASIKQAKEISKQIERVFLTEMLKVMFANTSLTKGRNLSTHMTVLIPEIAATMAEREIGLGRFLTENPSFIEGLTRNGRIELKPSLQTTPQEKSYDENKVNEGKFSLPKILSLPVNGEITSRFGFRIDPIDGKRRHHNGIDIAVPEGTRINPVLPGKVIYSGFSKGYGNCVIVEHEDGIQTIYAHNSKNLVKVGDRVSTDTVIALSGSTGRTTGPHLHFEVRKEGKPVNPLSLLNNYQKPTIS